MNEGNPTPDKWYWSKRGSDHAKAVVGWSQTKGFVKAGRAVAGVLVAVLLFGCSGGDGDELRDESESEKASRQGPACEEISGVYRGFYETSLNDNGLSQIVIHSDCEYELAEDIDEDGEFNVGINDKSVWSSGELDKSGDSRYTLEDGAVITVNGSAVRLSADYAEAMMQWKGNADQ
ncbi:hypothetical protein [Salinibacter sp.]|uniref:hypothetical protein n=1 Tax=Salinibacter sp. TaxID=2065818 RepID=UPI0021E8D8D4|nr:hypothetical protein [Salinibacter sp.]